MKETVAILLAGVCASTLMAGINNVVVTFSTPGPDTYNDGTPVMDGESYALVWTPDGGTFAGIDASGEALGESKVAIKAPIAEGGKCPRVQFQIDEEYANANFKGGTWGVYLLDTRVFQKDANGIVIKDENGIPKVDRVGGNAVNNYGVTDKLGEGQFASAEAGTALKSGVKSALKEGALKFTDIKLVDGYVYIYAEGAIPDLVYGIQSADTPQGVATAEVVDQYATKKDGKMVFIRPQSPKGCGFFGGKR